MPERVLIYGGTGFCGSHLAEACLEAGDEVTVTARKPRPWLDQHQGRIRFLQTDVLQAQSIREALEEAKPERIYHLAGLASVARSFSGEDQVYQVNILGTLNILKAIRELRPRARVLVVGSAEEYGPAPPPIAEDAPLAPLSPYGISRVASTLMAIREARANDLQVLATRTFNLVGPRQSRAFIASDFAAQIAEERARNPEAKSIRIHTGNLQVQRDFSSVLDAVRAYRELLEHGQPGEVYNLCSGQATRAQSLLDTLARIADIEVRQETDPARLRKTEAREIRGDPTKLKNTIGFAPAHLEEALKDLFEDWLRRAQSQI